MGIFQKSYSYKKPSQSQKFITNQKGFVLVLLIPFFGLMMTGLLGLSIMSLGIKNITFSQKVCLLENLSTQKQLKILLHKLLFLNKKVLTLHKKRKILESSLALGLTKGVAALKMQIAIIKFQQKILSHQQNSLLKKSQTVKKHSLKNLKQSLNKPYIQSVTEISSFKKPLALSKRKLSKEATTYHPLPHFSHQQKTIFSWTMNPFFPLYKSKFSKYQCIATLERSPTQWKERLFH